MTPKPDGSPFIEGAQQARTAYGRFNLAIIGDTGVGKSSLVNAVFGRDLAAVDKGLPVTSGVHYCHDDVLGIWDFEGFEIGDRSAAASLRDHLGTVARRPAAEQISVVWYCVLAGADRLTRAALDIISQIDAAGLPVILVLTKVHWVRNPVTGSYSLPRDTQDFVDWLQHPYRNDAGRRVPIDIPVRRVVATSTRDVHGKGSGHGLGELVEETLSLAPAEGRAAFRIAQRLNLPWKREMARPVIAAGAAAAATAAAVPIPVADATTLAPIQLTMMGRIAIIYDLELRTMLSAPTLAQLGTQLAGKALAGSLLKVIPGAGSVLNATVASSLTAALGEGWMQLCERVFTGALDASRLDKELGRYVPSVLDVIGRMAARKLGRGK